MSSVPAAVSRVDSFGVLARFRQSFYASLYIREDALLELTDALLCTAGPVKTLVELCLAAEHRRGHGGMYAALNLGDLEPRRLRRALVGTPLPKSRDGRITLAVDVSNWLRPDAATSADRLFCHTYGRGRSKDQFIPGWPYSFVAALETGPTSWTALLDAVLAENLIRAGHAACSYSCRIPPRRSCLRMSSRTFWPRSVNGVGRGCSGRALPSP